MPSDRCLEKQTSGAAQPWQAGTLHEGLSVKTHSAINGNCYQSQWSARVLGRLRLSSYGSVGQFHQEKSERRLRLSSSLNFTARPHTLSEQSLAARLSFHPHPFSPASVAELESVRQHSSSMTIHGITISDGQVRSADSTFLLLDIRSVHVQRDYGRLQRWLWFGGSILAVGLLQWIAFPFWLFAFWWCCQTKTYAVQVATSTGIHTLTTFSTFNTFSKSSLEKIGQQADEVVAAISQNLA